MNRVEEIEIASHRSAAIENAMRGCAHGAQWDARIARDHTEELHTTSGDAREENLRRRERLAGAPVLERTIDDEVLIARATQHSAERIRRTSFDSVLS